MASDLRGSVPPTRQVLGLEEEEELGLSEVGCHELAGLNTTLGLENCEGYKTRGG